MPRSGKSSDLNRSARLRPIADVFKEILQAVPRECADLKVDVQKDGEPYIRIVPRNPNSAPIAGRGRDWLRYELIAGEGSYYEVTGRDTQPDRAVAMVRAICAAVMSGGLEETNYTAGTHRAKTVSRLSIFGRVWTSTNWHGFYFRPKKKTVVRYQPYCDELDSTRLAGG
jgi:hypothetical protein